MAILNKLYSLINWKNYPSKDTPVNEPNLKKIDVALNAIDDRVIKIDAAKLDKTTANGMVKDVSLNRETGVFTITYLSGETVQIDTNLEKIAVNFFYDSDNQRLVITLEDGTEQHVDMKALLTQYEFMDSSTVVFCVDASGKVAATIKAGSITGDMLEPNYLAKIQVAAGQASGAADAAAASAAEAKVSEQAAADSEETSILKAAEASASAGSAADSESVALSAKTISEEAKEGAVSARDISVAKASEASASAQTASEKASAAASSQTAAETSAQISEQNAQMAAERYMLAKSYAAGGTGTRPGEDTDNAMYYMLQAQAQTGGIPTRLSQLQNDTGFITVAVNNLINYYKASQLYTKTEIDAKLSAIPKFAIAAVDMLPAENISDTTIYLLRERTDGTNKCSEWVYINDAWEKLGDIDIDLSGYLLKVGDGSNLTEIFAQANVLENISSGEKHSVIFGKIANAIATLISHVSTEASAYVLGHVKVDTALSSTSTNPLQNKAVNAALSGKLAEAGDASNVTTAFTEASSLQELSTGEKLSVSMGKLKLAVKNLKTIVSLLGNTDISQIEGGTVTGAISVLNRKSISIDNKLVLSRLSTVQTGIAENGEPYIQLKESSTDYYQITFKSDSIELGRQTRESGWKRIWIK